MTTRRAAMKYAAGGMLALLGTGSAVLAADAEQGTTRQDNTGSGAGQQTPPTLKPRDPSKSADDGYDQSADHKRVVAAGMTEAEADCWDAIAAAAGKFFALPQLHPSDNAEVATAIHVIQHKLLARPTYRKYLELARAEAGEKQ